MQKKFFLTYNGQSAQEQDINLLGEIGALADDRVLAELLRIAPLSTTGTVAKAILPHGHQASGIYGLVAPGALGQIDVRPFRAIIGSRTLEATDAQANWQDIRSGLSVAEGASSNKTTIVVGANATAFARIDLVYAALTLEGAGPSVPRKKKDPATGAPSDITVAVTKVTAVSVAVVQGTASATPALPALPSDGGNVYNIPLAYVRIDAGFSATSALTLRQDFHVVAPTVSIAPGVGAASLRAADSAYAADPTKLALWANTPSTRKASYVASDLAGEESLFVVLDLTSGLESHAPGDVVDASRDWRNRVSFYKGVAGTGAIPWKSTTPGLVNPEVYKGALHADFSGMGHSFPGATSTDRVVAYVDAASSALSEMTTGSNVKLYADDTTGALRVTYPTGASHPNCRLVMRLDMTGPF